MQTRFKQCVAIVCCLAFALTLAACATPAGRSAGQVVDDGTITTKVKAKLIKDSVLQGFAISVDTFQGEVTLTGAVNVPEQRERAGRIARETLGVKKVNNLLKVK
ncbi:MAG: BON domain-containing protein [Deltaproteobacteria bacterium]|nr:BON domain-containing protein [Deltaproteobacteria bacterium]